MNISDNFGVSFDGIGETVATFFAEGEIKPGDLVAIAKEDTVKVAGADENFIGVCVSAQNSIAAVQISGFAKIKMKTVGTTNFGRQFFVSDDDSSLKLSEATDPLAVPLKVVSIDKTSKILGVFL